MATTIALAGRRIDAPDAETPRFPLANVPLVRDRLRAFFVERGAGTLVCSAACGADLVALEAAESLGMRRRIVLPFDPARFRQTSVTDRPGDWGPTYDRLVETARREGDLVVLEGAGEGGRPTRRQTRGSSRRRPPCRARTSPRSSGRGGRGGTMMRRPGSPRRLGETGWRSRPS